MSNFKKNRSPADKSFNQGLDSEEEDLLESFERGEWKSVSNLEEEKAFAQEAAANYFRCR
jgi:hypothetical protein